MASARPVLSDAIRQVIQISKEKGQNDPKVIKYLLDSLPKNVRAEKQNNLAKGIVQDLADIIKKTNNTRKSTEAGKDLANKINQSRADRNAKVKEAVQPKDNTRFKYNESAQKAADNGMNKRDRPNIRNVTFGNNDDKSKATVRESLVRNGRELNRPEYNGRPRPNNTIRTANTVNTGRMMLANSMMGNLGAANVVTPLDKYNKSLIALSAGNNDWNTQGTSVPVSSDGTLYLDPNTKLPTEITKYDDAGLPMYFDTKDNIFKYIDVGADELRALDPNFDKRAYPALDSIIKRINGAKDLASLGTVYNPNADTSVNNPVPELYGSNNQSAIPSNQTSIPSTPNISTSNSNITIGSMANTSTPTVTPKNTLNKPATVASQASTPVTTRVNPQNVSMTQSVPVEEVSLSSIVKPLARRNGGFDEYRRQSALAALRNAGGMSPAEGVQRGIIPYEALQYI